MYFPGMAAEAGPSPWERVILDYAGETAAHCLGLLSRALEECREDPAVGTVSYTHLTLPTNRIGYDLGRAWLGK